MPTELTDAEINRLCAEFAGWKRSRYDDFGQWERYDENFHFHSDSLPDYLHDPVAADELMRGLKEQKRIFYMALNGDGLYRVSIHAAYASNDYPDWKEALAHAVAHLQIGKEAQNA